MRPHDVNGDYIMDDDDRVIVGSRRPAVTAGWTNTFTYKGIDLSFMIYGKFNYWVQKKVAVSGFGQLGQATDYWTPDNTDAEVQMPYLTSVDTGDNDKYRDALSYKKGNLVRVRNISLGYNFPVSSSTVSPSRTSRSTVRSSIRLTSTRAWQASTSIPASRTTTALG